MLKPAGLDSLVELGNSRFRAWVDSTSASLEPAPVPESFAGVQEALAKHKRVEGEISRTYAQQADLQELKAGLISLGQHVEAIDAIIAQFHISMSELSAAAKTKRQALETAKKSFEKIEDAKQRAAKAREKLLATFSSSVSAAFALFGETADLGEFPVGIWPSEQLLEYSKTLPSLDESLTKHLTQVQHTEVMLQDAKVTQEVLSFVSENLKAELARFAQELRTQRKVVAAELDRRQRSPTSLLGGVSTLAPYTPTAADSPTHTELKFVVTGPNTRRSTSERETRFSFVDRSSVSYIGSDAGSVTRGPAQRHEEEIKTRQFEAILKANLEHKTIVLRNFAAVVCRAITFFGNTADFPKHLPAIHPTSRDPGPSRLDLTDSQKYIIRLMGFLQEHGLHSEKIFSESGPENEQTALDAFTKNPSDGLRADLSSYNAHSVATALKRCLGAGEPLFPPTLFEPLLAIDVVTSGSKAQQIQDCLTNLPSPNRYCLAKLFHVITSVWGNQNDTKMDSRNLAHVFAPHLLKRPGEPSNLYQIITDLKATEGLVTKMIEEAHLIFGEHSPTELTLPDSVNFAQWPNERLFVFLDSLDAVDAKLTEIGDMLWTELERCHGKLTSLKTVEHLPLILQQLNSQRKEFALGQARRRELCALEVRRRGQNAAEERTRIKKLEELEEMYKKQRAAVLGWLEKAELVLSARGKSTLPPAEMQTLLTEVRAGRAEAVAILIAATDSAMDLQLKGSDWEAVLDIKQRVDNVVEVLARKSVA